MNITVYGGTNNKVYTPAQIAACDKLGAFLGREKMTILTGACKGYPYYVGRAAIKAGAKVIGYTPAVDLAEHTGLYEFLTDGVTDLVFTKEKYGTMSESFMRRSMDMTPFADVVVAMGGSWGTFSELVMSFMAKRTIILIDEFEGAVKACQDAYDFFGSRDVNPNVHGGAKIIHARDIDDAIKCIKALAKG
jgi:predicted Rossmann-fold nucleotide-binding protein